MTQDAIGIISVARTESEIATAAAAHGLVVSSACMPGVMANLAVLGGHADILRGGSAGDRP